MKYGAVIFAQNNAIIDYTKLAVFAAERVKKFLDVPVSIITDNKDLVPSNVFDQIIEIKSEPCSQRLFFDGSLSSKKLDWKNVSRNRVYDLTPYDKTLVLDSDFILCSSRLKQAFDVDSFFQLYHKNFDISLSRSGSYFDRINPYSIPFYWATVFVFEKNPIMECFFNLIDYIKLNWHYFRILYNIEPQIFRNDFAFSIAIHIMNGKTNGEFATELPGKMSFILEHDYVIDMNDTSISVLTQKTDRLGEYIAVKTSNIDVHIMNKMSLLRYIDGGSGV
jgi:hypothetical protein